MALQTHVSPCKNSGDIALLHIACAEGRAVRGPKQGHKLQAACRKLQEGQIQDQSPCTRRQSCSDWSDRIQEAPA